MRAEWSVDTEDKSKKKHSGSELQRRRKIKWEAQEWGVGRAGRRVLCRASHIDWHTGRGPGSMWLLQIMLHALTMQIATDCISLCRWWKARCQITGCHLQEAIYFLKSWCIQTIRTGGRGRWGNGGEEIKKERKGNKEQRISRRAP